MSLPMLQRLPQLRENPNLTLLSSLTSDAREVLQMLVAKIGEGKIYKRPRAAIPTARAPPIAGMAVGMAPPVDAPADAEERADEAALLRELRTELKLEAAEPVAVARAESTDEARDERDERALDCPLRMDERIEDPWFRADEAAEAPGLL